MGRNTDKLYVTQSEHSGVDGRHGSSTGITHKKISAPNRRLPFYYCSLTLQPWDHPVCAVSHDNVATIFDLLAIIPWLQTKGTDPTTGKSLDAKDLVKLNFAKNEQGEYCDPVTMKVFNDHTHIVSIRQTGNVFAYETVETLNYKAKNFKDLLSDERFTRADILTIQNPHDLTTHEKSSEGHNTAGLVQETDQRLDKDKKLQDARAAVARLRKGVDQQQSAQPPSRAVEKKTPLPYNAANYTTGYTAASFTSTGMTVKTANDRALLSEEQYLLHPKKIKTKALGIIKTNHGNMEIELWPEHAPKAVYNFVKLAKSGYYDGSIFHRSIPGFMIQGGDPTGRGTGGKSIFGKDFEDEISPLFSHDRRGLISMANKGPGTNSSQFFISYDSARHLDKKHTIFGHVIGGQAVLDILEGIPVKGDKPKSAIEMTHAQILLDPFEEYLDKEKIRRDFASKQTETTEDDLQTWTNGPVKSASKAGIAKSSSEDQNEAVGKYMKSSSTKSADVGTKRLLGTTEALPSAKKPKKTGFGDFAGW